MTDPVTALSFSIFENKGAYAVLLGSGVSRAAQIPTGWEITLDLVRRVALLDGVKEQSDWAAWYRKKHKADPSYSEQLAALTGSPEERRSILHSYIEPTEEDLEEGRKVPTPAHRAIARLVRAGFIRVILTTNFDRLMENALRDEGVEPTVIKSDDDLKGAVPLVHSRCYLVKLHGDYLDTRIKNTEDELASYSPEMNASLDRIIDEHGLIVCGWSADWDEALRSALTRAPNRRYTTFWAARGEPSSAAQDLIAHRAAKTIPINDADSFFTKVEAQVSIQVETQRARPESTALILGAARKYLARPEHRIQLAELVGETCRQLIQGAAGDEFKTQGNWSVEEFRQRVSRYEAISEPLARLFGVMGRWGDGSEFSLVADTLRDLSSVETAGGLTVWINLRTYPAVLALYGYGIGALVGRRFDVLYQWLTLPLRINRTETEPAVGRLLLWAWDGDRKEIWQNLEGFERRKTPLSDHLYEVLAPWTQDYLSSTLRHEEMFETFEVLAGLAHLTKFADKATLQAALAETRSDRDYVWTPVGRTAWNSETRDRVFSELGGTEMRKAVLRGGFCLGDEDFLSMATKSLQRLMSKIEVFG